MDFIHFMADPGIVLLMFTIGLDFNLKKLRAIGLSAILAGATEVSMMIALGYILGLAPGRGIIPDEQIERPRCNGPPGEKGG